VFGEPIDSAGMALKVLGNLFQSQNLIEWIGGWLSPIIVLEILVSPISPRPLSMPRPYFPAAPRILEIVAGAR
jgi:hypothetical protein